MSESKLDAAILHDRFGLHTLQTAKNQRYIFFPYSATAENECLIKLTSRKREKMVGEIQKPNNLLHA